MILNELIYECCNNNRKAQEQLYRELSPKLFTVCLKYSRGYDEAKDNLQEIFLIIFNKINQYSFKGSFEGWSKKIAINYILQRYRNQEVFEIVSENIANDDEIEIDDEELSMDYLIELVQNLPDRYRMVFNLYVLDDYSHKEIADMLNISIGTSKSNLARAKMILKEKIEKQKGIFPKAK